MPDAGHQDHESRKDHESGKGRESHEGHEDRGEGHEDGQGHADRQDRLIRRRFDAAQETLRQQHRMLNQFLLERYEPIAVVGVGMRLPGGNNSLPELDAFLREGRSGIGPLPRDRWNTEVAEDRITARAGGFLDRVDEFDAQFFNVPPRQAPFIDPAQRLLLETSWEALENAGADPAALRHGDGGVYVGASPLDFVLDLETLADEDLDGSLTTGLGGYSMSGRLSYFLGWRGPSLTTDTACASSLTALHLAVEGLRRHECSIALCAAANVLHNPRSFLILSHGQMLAADGHCKTFDESADGYARAEGCGALVLKRLSDALMDGDSVLALVRGTAIGQDGESAGLSAPNGTAQEGVMRAALANARLEPQDIQYVEAHGTGTPLGDPVELGSVSGVFGDSHSVDDPVTIGSLKANIGHMEPAAGLGAVLKVIAQMRAGAFYPHVWRTPSGRIPWDSIPVTVADAVRPWRAPVRRAMVNGFGVAGAIAVAVLEEPPPPQTGAEALEDRVAARENPRAAGAAGTAAASGTAGTAAAGAGAGAAAAAAGAAAGRTAEAGAAGHVFTLSAKSRPALRLQARRYLGFLEEHPGTGLADLCHTRAVARSHFRHRHAAAVTDLGQLTDRLERWSAPTAGDDKPDGFRKVAFLFTGSGAQYVGMGRSLYRTSAVFRRYADECDALFTPLLGRSVLGVMFGDAADAGELLAQTRYTHAALFTLEYALARLWLAWGLRPSVLIGHSVGEIVAATVAGLFSTADGVTFLAARAALIESVSRPGGMAAVPAPAADVAPLLAAWPDLAVAADNAPQQCVISGGSGSLAEAVAALRTRGWNATPLRVAAPFHSPLLAEVSEQLGKVLDGIAFHEPRLPLVSNVTGRIATPAELADPGYWIRHVNQTVEFAAGVRAVDERGRHVFLEVGPSAALTALARRCVDASRHRWLSSMSPEDPDGTQLHTALAGAYTAGLPLAWHEICASLPGRRVELPPYAFDRRPYRLPARPAARPGADGTHPLLGRERPPAAPAPGAPREPAAPSGGRRHSFEARISAAHPAYLADHTLGGRVFLPAAGYLELLLALQDELLGEVRRPVQDVRFHEALFLTDRPTLLLTRTQPRPDGGIGVEIASRPAADGAVPERLHVTAVIAPAPHDGTPTDTGRVLLDRLAAADASAVPESTLTGDQVRAAYAAAGLDYGPQFSRAGQVARYGADFAVTTLSGSDVSRAEHLPPPVLDAATHGLAALADDGEQYLATGVGHLRSYRKPRGERLRSALRVRWAEEDGAREAFRLDVLLLDETGGTPVMELAGMEFTRLARRPGAAPRPAGTPVPPPAAVDHRALRAAGTRQRREALTELVRTVTAALLSIDDPRDVDVRAGFLELGVDSLTAVVMKNRLEELLDLPLDSAMVFDHPTVEDLAAHLSGRLGTQAAPVAHAS